MWTSVCWAVLRVARLPLVSTLSATTCASVSPDTPATARTAQVCYGMVNIDLYSAIITTVNIWRTVVSATWKYDDPRLNMSHEGAARVWHVQPRVVIFPCRLTKYELLRWLVETPSRDFAHYRLSGGRRRIFTTCQELTSWHVDTCHEVSSWHVVNILRAAWSRLRFPADHYIKRNILYVVFVYILFCFRWFILLRFS